MIVVSDTTPLISLLKIERLDLLEKLFGQVMIPQAVFQELTSDKRFRDEADQITASQFVIVRTVENVASVNILKRVTGLDKGESEAIVLADELKADILLMDEAKGRTISGQMGIKVMGTIGLLMAAYDDGIIHAEEVTKCIDGLRKAGRHIGRRHYQMLLDRLKE
jgi:predicted nucleic acid-binding protein